MQDTALPWLVLQLTDSPSKVGLLVFCRYAPFLAFGLYAGALADRFDNRRFLVTTQASQVVTAGILAVLAFTTTEPWPFFVLATVSGAGTILDAPSRQAFTYRIVGRNDLPNAIALTSSVFNAGLVIGPAAGGVLIATLGAGWCFTVNATSFLVLLFSLLLMRVSELSQIDPRPNQTARAAIHQALLYAWRTPRMKLVLTVVATFSLAGFNFRVLIPILADRTLHSGSETLGSLFAAFGGGSVTGALAAATIGRASWSGLVAGAVTFNIALLVLAPVRNVAVVAALLFVVGAAFVYWIATAQAILQVSAPDELRGRVMSLFVFAWTAFAPISAILAGWICEVGGTDLALTVAGVVGLIAIGLSGVWVRRGAPLAGRA